MRCHRKVAVGKVMKEQGKIGKWAGELSWAELALY